MGSDLNCAWCFDLGRNDVVKGMGRQHDILRRAKPYVDHLPTAAEFDRKWVNWLNTSNSPEARLARKQRAQASKARSARFRKNK